MNRTFHLSHRPPNHRRSAAHPNRFAGTAGADARAFWRSISVRPSSSTKCQPVVTHDVIDSTLQSQNLGAKQARYND